MENLKYVAIMFILGLIAIQGIGAFAKSVVKDKSNTTQLGCAFFVLLPLTLAFLALEAYFLFFRK